MQVSNSITINEITFLWKLLLRRELLCHGETCICTALSIRIHKFSFRTCQISYQVIQDGWIINLAKSPCSLYWIVKDDWEVVGSGMKNTPWLSSIVLSRADCTIKFLHETKLKTTLHKLFGEIFGRVCWNNLKSFEMFRV